MKLGSDFIGALRLIVEEKNLSEDVVVSSLEAALASAYRKYKDKDDEVEVFIDRTSGDVQINEVYNVVDQPTEQGDVTVDEAKKLGFKDAKLGEKLRKPVTVMPEKFGRIAAQTARQVIIQRLKDAEREVVYNEFAEKIGDLVTGEIFKAENDQIYVKLSERSEALLGREERIEGEKYEPGTKKKFYLLDVRQTTRAPRIIVSRTHPGLIRRLLELSVPEIRDGVVEIMGIVREPGVRAKIAVRTLDPEVDPLGACVGTSGLRIKGVTNELYKEKVDVIIWSEDPAQYISNVLSPAKPTRVELVDPEGHAAKVYVPKDQLSLAIGKAGLNVRLAAKLTGWRVDILPEPTEGKRSVSEDVK